MGLFNRRAETKQEFQALRAELHLMHSRLEEAEREKRQMAAHLDQIGSTQEQITTQVATVERQVGSIAGSIAPAIDTAIVHAASAADVELIQIELHRMSGLAAHLEQLRETVAAHQLAVASNGDATWQWSSAPWLRVKSMNVRSQVSAS
jgi:chromosome segregation ATPase